MSIKFSLARLCSETMLNFRPVFVSSIIPLASRVFLTYNIKLMAFLDKNYRLQYPSNTRHTAKGGIKVEIHCIFPPLHYSYEIKTVFTSLRSHLDFKSHDGGFTLNFNLINYFSGSSAGFHRAWLSTPLRGWPRDLKTGVVSF